MQAQRIQSVKKIGKRPCLDLEVNSKDHNFYANGIVTSNSHSISYAYNAAQTVYLKVNYPTQFYLTLLRFTKDEQDPIGEIAKICQELSLFNIKLLPPHILKSKLDFEVSQAFLSKSIASNSLNPAQW